MSTVKKKKKPTIKIRRARWRAERAKREADPVWQAQQRFFAIEGFAEKFALALVGTDIPLDQNAAVALTLARSLANALEAIRPKDA